MAPRGRARRKSTAKKTTGRSKSTERKATAKKTAARRKSSTRKTTAKKTAARRKSSTRKTTAKKTAARRKSTRKTTAKKTAARRKSSTRKTTGRQRSGVVEMRRVERQTAPGEWTIEETHVLEGDSARRARESAERRAMDRPGRLSRHKEIAGDAFLDGDPDFDLPGDPESDA